MRMVLKYNTMLLLLVLSLSVYGQSGLHNNGCHIVIPDGAYVFINGDEGNYTNSSSGSAQHGSIELSGKLILEGDWENNALGGNLLLNTSGEVVFNGSVTQQIGGSRTTHFSNIHLNEDVKILQAFNLSSELNLDEGSLFLGNNDLTLLPAANIVNFDANHFIVTNGTGGLSLNVNAGGPLVVYPLGTSNSFLPVQLQQGNAASSGMFKVRLIEGVWSNGIDGTNLALTQECINKTWLIESDADTIDMNMMVQWNQMDEVNGFDRQQCYISHFENGTWDMENVLSASGTSAYQLSRDHISSLSPFAVAGDNDSEPLPVEWLDFSVQAISFDALVEWSTGSEQNCMGYEVLRSFDGETFHKVAYVSGNGNSILTHTYSYKDMLPTNGKAGIVYYKIKQIDFNGAFEYSKTLQLIFTNNQQNDIRIVPNPTYNQITIVGDYESYDLLIFSSKGQLLSSLHDSQQKTVDLSHLDSGVYVVKIRMQGVESVRRIVKL